MATLQEKVEKCAGMPAREVAKKLNIPVKSVYAARTKINKRLGTSRPRYKTKAKGQPEPMPGQPGQGQIFVDVACIKQMGVERAYLICKLLLGDKLEKLS